MYKFTNRGDSAEILIYEDIGEGWFGGVSAQRVIDDLKGASGSSVSVRINSPGGDAFEGVAIHNALKRHDGLVTVHVDALAASAASIIAMAGNEIRMGAGSMMMIHNPHTIAWGDAAEMRRAAELLDGVRDGLVAIYESRFDSPDTQQIIDWLDAETWFTADEAIEAGLADTHDETVEQIAASLVPKGRFRNTPKSLLSKEPEKPAPAWRREAAARKLELMRRL